MGIQTGGEGGQNSHGEADAGPQRVAAVRMTVRAAAEVFMVPGAEAAGDGIRCLRILCRDALQLRQTFLKGGRAAEEMPPLLWTGGVSTTDTKH